MAATAGLYRKLQYKPLEDFEYLGVVNDVPMTLIGTAPAMTALVGGQVDVMCDQTTNTSAQIESGRVKAFAVTTAGRLVTRPL